MKKVVEIIFFLTVLVSSCARFPDIGFLTRGMWAIVDEDGWTSRYLLFENGQVHVYSSGDKKYRIQGQYCNGASESDFVLVESHRYSIVDGILYSADNAINISVDPWGYMILGNKELYNFYSFDFNPPCIYLTEVSFPIAATGGSGYIDYVIANPLYGSGISVSAPEWIEIVNITDNRITFNILPYYGYVSREDLIVLSYPVTFDGESYDIEETVWINQTPGNSSYLSLSSSGTANSYIVSGQGAYMFETVKGNSRTSVGNVISAEVLWESFGTDIQPQVGDLIRYVSYNDGYIAFHTSDVFKEGNAVIAAKDASGTILWSWHIWLTDEPQGQVYYNNAGTMMDRNLGATSATPGDVGALGLLYQWGRKDPFLGSSSISSSTVAKSTITWPSPVLTSSSCGKVSYVTANPTTFVYDASSNDNDWHYSSRDNTLWTTSDKTKSIYDPCPAGWRVPDGGDNGVWSKALGSSSSFYYLYSSTTAGMYFSGKFGSASSIWYPDSGCRDYRDGSLNNVGSDGYYWSASTYNDDACCLHFNDRGYVVPWWSGFRADGRSVRCLQE